VYRMAQDMVLLRDTGDMLKVVVVVVIGKVLTHSCPYTAILPELQCTII
jgi:hypothetical protein